MIGDARELQLRAERSAPSYMKARAELDKRVPGAHRTLPPATRAKLENATSPTCAARRARSPKTLAEHPSDPLLQELLMSTYQSELQLLANVSEMPTATREDRSMRVAVVVRR